MLEERCQSWNRLCFMLEDDEFASVAVVVQDWWAGIE